MHDLLDRFTERGRGIGGVQRGHYATEFLEEQPELGEEFFFFFVVFFVFFLADFVEDLTIVLFAFFDVPLLFGLEAGPYVVVFGLAVGLEDAPDHLEATGGDLGVVDDVWRVGRGGCGGGGVRLL